MELIRFNELVPVAKLGNHIILFVREVDADNPMAFCVQAHLESRKFYPVQWIQYYLKSNPFESVKWRDPEIRYLYHDIISRTYLKEAIEEMILDFVAKVEDSN